jgi:hypothetical protein
MVNQPERLSPVNELNQTIDQYKTLIEIGLLTNETYTEAVIDILTSELEKIGQFLHEAGTEKNFQKYYTAIHHNLTIRKIIHETGLRPFYFSSKSIDLLNRITAVSKAHPDWLFSPEITALIRSGEYSKYVRG